MSKDNVCSACGQSRKKKSLVFDKNFKPFCSSHWVCNDKHPNHPSQREEYGHVTLMTYDEMQEERADAITESEYDIFKNFMTKPFSVRIQDLQTVLFLRDLQHKQNLSSYSEAIRYCISVVMGENKEIVKDANEIYQKPIKPKKEVSEPVHDNTEEEF